MQRRRASAVVSEWGRARIRWPPAGLIPRFQGGNRGCSREVTTQQLHLHRRGAHVQTDKEEGHVAGFATVNDWTDDMEAATRWDAELLASSRTSSAPDQTGAGLRRVPHPPRPA
jgi:hypothetical protein